MSEISNISALSPAIELRMAQSPEDIEAIQKLRWQVFYEEMGAIPDPQRAGGLDSDRFDAVCDHLMVIDSSADSVVGTYRLLRQSVAMRHGGFYSAAEYDLRRLVGYSRASGGELLELGRSCVLPQYRSSAAIALLWRGIAHYLERHDIALMFGCASFPEADIDRHAKALSYLRDNHLAPVEIRPAIHPEFDVAIPYVEVGIQDRRAVMQGLPPLLKAYLRVGPMFADGAFYDWQFNTVDVSVVMPVERIAQRYSARFSAAA